MTSDTMLEYFVSFIMYISTYPIVFPALIDLRCIQVEQCFHQPFVY